MIVASELSLRICLLSITVLVHPPEVILLHSSGLFLLFRNSTHSSSWSNPYKELTDNTASFDEVIAASVPILYDSMNLTLLATTSETVRSIPSVPVYR